MRHLSCIIVFRISFLLLMLLLSSSGHASELGNILSGNSVEPKPTQDKVIETNNTSKDDVKIRRRLQEIFKEVDALNGITIVVNKGVVTLNGSIDTATDIKRAVQFARQVDGVVEVENELLVSRNLKKRLLTTWKKIQAMGEQIIATLPLVLIALLIFISFWLFGRWVSRRQSFYRRISPNYFIAVLLGQITHFIFIIMGLVFGLMLLDATALIGTILGAAGIVGLAVGFAVRDTVENYIASILLSLRNPFEINDLVNINGQEGNVARLTSRATILISPDGNHIRIPNAAVFKAVIINYSRHPERRFEFDVGIDTEQSLIEAQSLAFDTLSNVKGVLAEPKPFTIVHELGDSNVVLRIFAWVDQDHFNFGKVRSETIRAIKQAFDDAGIVMPEPIYKLRMYNTEINEYARSVTENQPGVVPRKSHISDADISEVQDVSVDHTMEEKVSREQEQGDDENLLSPDSPKEI